MLHHLICILDGIGSVIFQEMSLQHQVPAFVLNHLFHMAYVESDYWEAAICYTGNKEHAYS